MGGRIAVGAGLALVLLLAGAAAWMVLSEDAIAPPPTTDAPPPISDEPAPSPPTPGRQHVSETTAPDDDADVEIVERGPDGGPTKAQRIRWIREWMDVLCASGFGYAARIEARQELLKFPVEELLPIVMDRVEGDEENGVGWAFTVLYVLADKAEPMAPRLVRLMQGDAEWVADCAARTLSEMGSVGEPYLLGALDAEASRGLALQYLYRSSGGLSAAAVPHLLEYVDADSVDVRAGALRALGEVHGAEGVVVPALVVGLQDEDQSVRAACLLALATDRSRALAAIGDIRQFLDDDDDTMRIWAIHALECIGPEAAADAPRIVDLIPTMTGRFRSRIPVALSGIGPDAYLAGFGHDAAEVRIELLRGIDLVIEEHPDAAPSVVEALSDLLDDPDADVRAEAAARIGGLAESARDATTTAARLRKAVDDPEPRVVRAAIVALAKVAGATDDVLGILLRELREGTAEDRAAAAGALGEVGPQAATPTLVNALADALDDNEPSVRRRAAAALETMGEAASSTSANLGARLSDPDSGVRIAAALALMAVDPPGIAAKDAVHALRVDDLRLTLIRGLGRHPNVLWVPILEDRMTDRDSRVRLAALESAAHFGALAVPLIDAILDRAGKDRDWNVRRAAVEALGALGKHAEAAIPALEEMRRDFIVREAVAEALLQIRRR